MSSSSNTRLRINVNGIVQGVGFRPFVSRLATEKCLTGFVRNSNSGIEIEIEGKSIDIESFLSQLRFQAPPLSEIVNVDSFPLEIKNSTKFEIIASEEVSGNQTIISPDVSICDDCLHELLDPTNRRYLYPFINCTNCGPRLTIIENIPYDRKYTTMYKFKMCEECEAEYHNINNRRYHAQPNACPKCGPNVWFEGSKSASPIFGNDAIKKAAEDLAGGKIIAVKGLGGFHLAADALNNEAVNKLRERKQREEKPLAIMVNDLKSLMQIVDVDDLEKNIVTGYLRPILLLKKKKSLIAESVAPGNKRLGVMIAYTPLHHILFHMLESHYKINSPVLVMTSANYSEEPIEISNEGAKERLSLIADGFLFHNRDILIRADDSVAMFVNNKLRMIRRSRGYIPKPFFIKKTGSAVLGVGAELKNTICLLKDDASFISQHIGNLNNFPAYEFFKKTINYFQKILNLNAKYVAYDLHPDYLSTKWARHENFLPSFGIQHHHAHMASCMGEFSIDKDVIGVILDGTGYGIDNTIWGGEILVGGFTKIKRFSHLEYFPLPGGDTAIKEPWRIGIGYLYNTFDGKFSRMEFMDSLDVNVIIQMLEKKINCPLTSSAGRLFDAVSVICGGPKIISYEAQAAIEFMQKVENINEGSYEVEDLHQKSIPLKPLIRDIIADVNNRVPVSTISSRFHKTFVKILINKIEEAKKEFNINDVVLSGGVFQNEIILELMENNLIDRGFNVYSHSKIPTNDGGISFGQVLVANELIAKGMSRPEYEL